MPAPATDLTAIALVTTVAMLCGLLLTRLRQPAIVGYILAGVVLGPTGFGLVINDESVRMLAELGVLMLLFLIGMELSLRAFKTVLRLALFCALLQIVFCLAVTFGFAALLGWSVQQALLLGFLMSISGTAVSIAMLEDIGELRTQTGRITIGVLIAQDLSVVPMLVLIRSLDTGQWDWQVGAKLAVAIGLLAALVWLLSRRHRVVLPVHGWLRGKRDLIPLAALAFCFSAATLSGLFGLTAAYGAFLAGLVVGNSTSRRPTIHATHPIQSVLMVVFFLSIGLLIDLRFLWRHWETVLAVLAVVVLIKTVINIATLRLLGEPRERAFPAGVIMGQLGEFSFVLAAAGLRVGAIDQEAYRLAIAVIALSLLISPLWLVTTRRFHALARDGISSLRTALREVYKGELTAAGRGLALVQRGGGAAVAGGRAVAGRLRLRPAPARALIASRAPLAPAAESAESAADAEATAVPPAAAPEPSPPPESPEAPPGAAEPEPLAPPQAPPPPRWRRLLARRT